MAMAYLIMDKNLSPDAAQRELLRVRPHVRRARYATISAIANVYSLVNLIYEVHSNACAHLAAPQATALT